MKRGLLAAIAAALIVAGCGSSAGLDVGGTESTGNSESTGTAASAKSSTSSGVKMNGAGMAAMSMGTSTGTSSTASGATAVPSVNGVKPVPSQILATTHWQGMTIQARTMTPIPFYIYTGTRYRIDKPSKHTSFHLMVMLNDQHTNEPIPYATVWATIRKGDKVVYDHSQWPMISAYMGPHYGNNVTLPGAGKYKLTLLVGPPVAARHVEYKSVWLKPHRITVSFTWHPPK